MKIYGIRIFLKWFKRLSIIHICLHYSALDEEMIYYCKKNIFLVDIYIMRRTTTRQKAAYLGSCTNQIGLNMSGNPSSVGRAGYLGRYIGSRVQSNQKYCGPIMYQGQIWRTNDEPCVKKVPRGESFNSGVGHIGAPRFLCNKNCKTDTQQSKNHSPIENGSSPIGNGSSPIGNGDTELLDEPPNPPPTQQYNWKYGGGLWIEQPGIIQHGQDDGPYSLFTANDLLDYKKMTTWIWDLYKFILNHNIDKVIMRLPSISESTHDEIPQTPTKTYNWDPKSFWDLVSGYPGLSEGGVQEGAIEKKSQWSSFTKDMNGNTVWLVPRSGLEIVNTWPGDTVTTPVPTPTPTGPVYNLVKIGQRKASWPCIIFSREKENADNFQPWTLAWLVQNITEKIPGFQFLWLPPSLDGPFIGRNTTTTQYKPKSGTSPATMVGFGDGFDDGTQTPLKTIVQNPPVQLNDYIINFKTVIVTGGEGGDRILLKKGTVIAQNWLKAIPGGFYDYSHWENMGRLAKDLTEKSTAMHITCESTFIGHWKSQAHGGDAMVYIASYDKYDPGFHLVDWTTEKEDADGKNIGNTTTNDDPINPSSSGTISGFWKFNDFEVREEGSLNPDDPYYTWPDRKDDLIRDTACMVQAVNFFAKEVGTIATKWGKKTGIIWEFEQMSACFTNYSNFETSTYSAEMLITVCHAIGLIVAPQFTKSLDDNWTWGLTSYAKFGGLSGINNGATIWAAWNYLKLMDATFWKKLYNVELFVEWYGMVAKGTMHADKPNNNKVLKDQDIALLSSTPGETFMNFQMPDATLENYYPSSTFAPFLKNPMEYEIFSIMNLNPRVHLNLADNLNNNLQITSNQYPPKVSAVRIFYNADSPNVNALFGQGELNGVPASTLVGNSIDGVAATAGTLIGVSYAPHDFSGVGKSELLNYSIDGAAATITVDQDFMYNDDKTMLLTKAKSLEKCATFLLLNMVGTATEGGVIAIGKQFKEFANVVGFWDKVRAAGAGAGAGGVNSKDETGTPLWGPKYTSLISIEPFFMGGQPVHGLPDLTPKWQVHEDSKKSSPCTSYFPKKWELPVFTGDTIPDSGKEMWSWIKKVSAMTGFPEKGVNPSFMYFSQAYTMAAFADSKQYNTSDGPFAKKPPNRYDQYTTSSWATIQNGNGPPYTSLEVPSNFLGYPCTRPSSPKTPLDYPCP